MVVWGAGTTDTGVGFEYGQSIVPANLSGVTAIATGDNHTLALKSDGTVVAWGAGTITTGISPHWGQSMVPVGLSGVAAIAAGDAHTVALKADGTVVSWGAGKNSTGVAPEYGQSIVPVGLSGVTAVAAGGFHTVAVVQAASFSFGGLKFYTGTTLEGIVGQQFRVDYADVLGGVTNWLTLSNLTLPYSPFLVIDPASPGRTNRFYRAVPLP